MSWAKLDDGFWMHPKVITAGNEAAGVFARFLSYCGCYLTDGLIPAEIVKTITPTMKPVETLARVGLVVQMESGSVVIPDFLEHNRSKAQVEADREQRARNGAKGGRRSSRYTPPESAAAA